jgi:hypothetical protein
MATTEEFHDALGVLMERNGMRLASSKPAPVADSYTLYLDLQSEFAYATECELATLEGLNGKTRTPACELRRHEAICERMVGVCRKHRISPHPSLPRLSKRLLEMMR